MEQVKQVEAQLMEKHKILQWTQKWNKEELDQLVDFLSWRANLLSEIGEEGVKKLGDNFISEAFKITKSVIDLAYKTKKAISSVFLSFTQFSSKFKRE